MSVGAARLREDADRIRQGAIDKGEDPAVVDRALAADARRRDLLSEGDRLKAVRNSSSKEIGAAVRGGADPDGPEVAALRQASSDAGTQIADIDAELAAVEAQLDDLLLRIPNPADPDVPVGGEDANVTVRAWGDQLPRVHPDAGDIGADASMGAWERKPHWELAERLGMFDLERGAKIAGSGFPVYRAAGAALQRALIDWFLEVHTREHGMTEIWPPAIVNADSARGTGQIPDKEDQMYVVTRDDLYLVPTAEVPVTNLHRDEIIDPTELPIRYAAYSPCFRREAGAAGRDTRGILRVHQFDKVEMVFFERPEEFRARARTVDGLRRDAPAAARPRLPGDPDGHPRDGLRPGAQVRPRGLGAGRRAVARGQLLLELPRLPGAPHGDPLPGGRGRATGARPHAQRIGPRPAADRGCDPGDLPAARWLRCRARRAAWPHGRRPDRSAPGQGTGDLTRA